MFKHMKIFTVGALMAVVCASASFAAETLTKPNVQDERVRQERLAAISKILENVTKLHRLRVSGLDLKFDTPDNAVKSWWALQGANKETRRLLSSKTSFITNPPLSENGYAAAIHPRSLPHHSSNISFESQEVEFRKSIQEVKSESESRAIVFVLMKPILPNFDNVIKSELKQAREGTEVKYILVKTEGRWWIEDIQKRVDEVERIANGSNPWVSVIIDENPSKEAHVVVRAL